jgi:predicted glutamine amidotransferase
MCGIAGYKAFGKEKPTKKELEGLLIGIMDRGKDATGIAWLEKGGLCVYKDAVTSEDFITHKVWKNLRIPSVMIMHARQGTGGSADKNENNHPIFSKEGIAIVHNGVLYNEKDLYTELKITPDAEVDSEILLHLMKDWWRGIKSINKVRGSYACAVLSHGNFDELILFRHTNPICYYMDKERDILFFASTKPIIKSIFGTTHRGFKLYGVSCYEIPEDTAILIGKNGIEKTQKLVPTTATSFYTGGSGFRGYGSGYDRHDFSGYESGYGKDWKKKDKKTATQSLLDYKKEKEEREALIAEGKDTQEYDGYGHCSSCRKWSRLLVTRIGNICVECNDFWLSNELECPWCKEKISYNDMDVGLCPSCNNEIKPNTVDIEV